MTSILDSALIEFDNALRTVAGVSQAARPMPRSGVKSDLVESERRQAAALMRVNHCGEVCAQALYQGQRLGSRTDSLKSALSKAAAEENDHLGWSAQRVRELGGRLSLFAPLWYAGSLALGYTAGRMGDEWNLGFLAETERQVEEHLQGHLERLSPDDADTRALIETMQREEAAHARMAEALGARALPAPVRHAMRALARVMTSVSYRL